MYSYEKCFHFFVFLSSLQQILNFHHFFPIHYNFPTTFPSVFNHGLAFNTYTATNVLLILNFAMWCYSNVEECFCPENHISQLTMRSWVLYLSCMDAGNYTYTLLVSDDECCSWALSKQLQILYPQCKELTQHSY